MTEDVLYKLKYLTEREKEALLKFEKEVRETLSSNLILLEVFGSKARGDFTEESDMDILVVVKKFEPVVMEKMAAISSGISIKEGILISPLVLSESEYKKNRYADTLFVRELDRDGVLIYGAAQ